MIIYIFEMNQNPKLTINNSIMSYFEQFKLPFSMDT